MKAAAPQRPCHEYLAKEAGLVLVTSLKLIQPCHKPIDKYLSGMGQGERQTF